MVKAREGDGMQTMSACTRHSLVEGESQVKAGEEVRSQELGAVRSWSAGEDR